MSQLSKVKHSRAQWKHKAKQRGDRERYQHKQIARLTAERHRATQALTAARARLRQLESQPQGRGALPQVDAVLCALQLCFVARMSVRACCTSVSCVVLAFVVTLAS